MIISLFGPFSQRCISVRAVCCVRRVSGMEGRPVKTWETDLFRTFERIPAIFPPPHPPPVLIQL